MRCFFFFLFKNPLCPGIRTTASRLKAEIVVAMSQNKVDVELNVWMSKGLQEGMFQGGVIPY
jgi:hypothetical protein